MGASARCKIHVVALFVTLRFIFHISSSPRSSSSSSTSPHLQDILLPHPYHPIIYYITLFLQNHPSHPYKKICHLVSLPGGAILCGKYFWRIWEVPSFSEKIRQIVLNCPSKRLYFPHAKKQFGKTSGAILKCLQMFIS